MRVLRAGATSCYSGLSRRQLGLFFSFSSFSLFGLDFFG